MLPRSAGALIGLTWSRQGGAGKMRTKKGDSLFPSCTSSQQIPHAPLFYQVVA